MVITCTRKFGVLLLEKSYLVREVENYREPFTVAVVRSGVIVGHVPRKISSVCSTASFSAIRTLRLFGFDHSLHFCVS